MSQRDIRAQRQNEQDERRLSLHRNNAYFTFVSPHPDKPSLNNQVDELRPALSERPRSCSPTLMTAQFDAKSNQNNSLLHLQVPLLHMQVPIPVSSVATSTVTSLSTTSAPTLSTTTTSVLCTTTTAETISAEPTTSTRKPPTTAQL